MASAIRHVARALWSRNLSYGFNRTATRAFIRAAEGDSAVDATDQGPVSVQLPVPSVPGEEREREREGDSLTPSKVVQLLDRYIIGQADAKRAVAVALRNRWRRHKVESPLREEIVPKNILMIGPTGCGKTEIARRLAKLADAPFVKVEATKFTEVGFHGRDVDQIIRDLLENAILMQRQKVRNRTSKDVELAVESRLLDLIVGEKPTGGSETERSDVKSMRERVRNLLRSKSMENTHISLEVPDTRVRTSSDMSTGTFAIIELMNKFEKAMKGSMKAEKKSMTIGEARPILTEIEMEKYLSAEHITKDAIQSAEADGIVFIDEIDKIVTSHEARHGADASSEGVQRDLLPIIEGSTVSTKHGSVCTDHVLFICSGAFHSCQPKDMMAELQGRLPIRVELKGLSEQDLYRILSEPEHNLVAQAEALLRAEDIGLKFTEGALREMASVAAEVNKAVDNIGARRLHTVLERVVEDISFHAPERAGRDWVIDAEDVRKAVGPILQKTDLSKYIL